jgi:hypothetical protein
MGTGQKLAHKMPKMVEIIYTCQRRQDSPGDILLIHSLSFPHISQFSLSNVYLVTYPCFFAVFLLSFLYNHSKNYQSLCLILFKGTVSRDFRPDPQCAHFNPDFQNVVGNFYISFLPNMSYL